MYRITAKLHPATAGHQVVPRTWDQREHTMWTMDNKPNISSTHNPGYYMPKIKTEHHSDENGKILSVKKQENIHPNHRECSSPTYIQIPAPSGLSKII